MMLAELENILTNMGEKKTFIFRLEVQYMCFRR